MSWPPLPGDGWYLLNVIGQADVSRGAGPSIWGQGGGSAGPHAGQRSAHWESSLPECLGCKCVSRTGGPTVQRPPRSPRQRASRARPGLRETVIVPLPMCGDAVGTEEPVGIDVLPSVQNSVSEEGTFGLGPETRMDQTLSPVRTSSRKNTC